MALNDLLHIGSTGLAAAEAGLRNVSNNIANVGTAGYSRQKVSQTPTVLAGRVTGVAVSEPSRVADRYLEQAVFRNAAGAEGASVRASTLDRLQALFGAAGAETGIPARLNAIVSSAIGLTSAQSQDILGATLTSQLQDTTAALSAMSADMQALRTEAHLTLQQDVESANDLLARIHSLNDAVAKQLYVGRDASGLIDQRNTALQSLSGLLQVEVRDMPDGRVTVETGSGVMLVDRQLRQLSMPLAGSDQPLAGHPPLSVRLVDGVTGLDTDTGATLDSVSAGGRIGATMEMRDGAIPAAMDELDSLYRTLAGRVNAAANQGSTVPAPAELVGRDSGLAATDRLGFTGAIRIAATTAAGSELQAFVLDFDALGAGATVGDAIAAINAGMGGAVTATLSDGVLSLKAGASGSGVALGAVDGRPDSRAGTGFSQLFGLNDVLRASAEPLVSPGFAATDAHGFAAGQSAEIVLRDSSGRLLAKGSVTGSTGSTFGDLISEMNATPLGRYGSFSLDSEGAISFQPGAAFSDARLVVTSDSTSRLDTGVGLSALTRAGSTPLLAGAALKAGVSASGFPLGRLVAPATAGQSALVRGDGQVATALADRLQGATTTPGTGTASLESRTATLVNGLAQQADRAASQQEYLGSMQADAIQRRDAVSAVNIDEELSQMVILQNSYSAAARLITAAQDMYDMLLEMTR